MEELKLILIVGPTASGKTAASIYAATKLNGEIVSADSIQVYKGMDIGSAKPTMQERQGIPHHLMDAIDINSPKVQCSGIPQDGRGGNRGHSR